MIVQTRYMKGKQVNRATIFDFVQAHKNDGDNIISNDRINASWCIEFLIDYLYQVISIFNEAIENVKAGVNNPVSDTGLEELYIKLIEPSSEFNGLIMNDLKIDSNDKQTLEAIKVDKLDDLTVTELITQKKIIERLIKNNRKQAGLTQEEIAQKWEIGEKYEPSIDEEKKEKFYKGWKKAVERTKVLWEKGYK